MNCSRKYTPVMIVGFVAAAFFSHTSSGNTATLAATAQQLPTIWCSAGGEPFASGGDNEYYCASDATSRSEIYWDGTYPTPLPPSYEMKGAAYSETGSRSVAVFAGGSRGTVVTSGTSKALGQAYGNSEFTISARDSSSVNARVSNSSYGAAGASDNSHIGVSLDDNSVANLSASTDSVVLASVTGGSYLGSSLDSYVTATRGSTVLASVSDRSSVDVVASDNSRTLLLVQGHSNMRALANSSDIFAYAADGANVNVAAMDSKVAVAALGTSQIYVDASGVSVGAVSIGAGSTSSVTAHGAAGSKDHGSVTVIALNGGEASVQADTVIGEAITAVASGEGSRSYISVDGATGVARKITVYAFDGGTAYVVGETGTVGCFGGRTSVVSQYGSCSSNGNETIITGIDGSSTTYHDLQAPIDLVSPVAVPSDSATTPSTSAARSLKPVTTPATVAPTPAEPASKAAVLGAPSTPQTSPMQAPTDTALAVAPTTSSTAPVATTDTLETNLQTDVTLSTREDDQTSIKKPVTPAGRSEDPRAAAEAPVSKVVASEPARAEAAKSSSPDKETVEEKVTPTSPTKVTARVDEN